MSVDASFQRPSESGAVGLRGHREVRVVYIAWLPRVDANADACLDGVDGQNGDGDVAARCLVQKRTFSHRQGLDQIRVDAVVRGDVVHGNLSTDKHSGEEHFRIGHLAFHMLDF